MNSKTLIHFLGGCTLFITKHELTLPCDNYKNKITILMSTRAVKLADKLHSHFLLKYHQNSNYIRI